MPEVQLVTVSAAEGGQKLLQYLQRRLGKDVPKSALMKWIRKGHVRVNKGRVKPFDRVDEGDVVRIPPYRVPDGDGASPTGNVSGHGPDSVAGSVEERCAREDLTVLASTDDVLVLHKPSGVPVQPGSGHDDSIATRLAAAFRDADFCPSPAHRLDKNTSGVLLAGLTYRGLRRLQEGFADGHAIRKEYLVWVTGRWPHKDTVVLEDVLVKDAGPESGLSSSARGGAGRQGAARGAGRSEKVRSISRRPDVSASASGQKNGSADDLAEKEGASRSAGKHASCSVQPVTVGKEASLLLVTLHTGRTHQIRVQLSERGHALVGDPKYGGPKHAQGLLLHAWRVTLPTGDTYSVLPEWKGKFAVQEGLLG